MEFAVYLRFKGIGRDHSRIGFAELGESLVGFDYVFRELGRVANLEEALEVDATSPERGSIIVEALIRVSESGIGFERIEDLVAALKIAKDPLLDSARNFFDSALEVRRTLNDWVAANPIDAAAIGAVLAKLFQELLKKARKAKKTPDFTDPELPARIAEELHKLIRKKAFKRALTPITEGQAESIEVSADREFQNPAVIDGSNFQDYLTEEEQILPDLKNGDVASLVGSITSLRGTRGDSMTFHMEHEGVSYNLDTQAADGATSKDYRSFYQEKVELKAMVVRDSFYKKPRLKLFEIHLLQPQLELEDVPFDTADNKGAASEPLDGDPKQG